MAAGTEKQRVQQELAAVKRTLAGNLRQLRRILLAYVPGAPEWMLMYIEKSVLRGLQAKAKKHGIKGDWSAYLPLEQTRYYKRFMKMEVIQSETEHTEAERSSQDPDLRSAEDRQD